MTRAACPLLPLAAAFAAGLAAIAMPGRPWSAPSSPVLLGAGGVLLVGGGLALAKGHERVTTAAVIGIALALGAVRALSHPLPGDHVARHELGTPVRLEGQLVEEPRRWAPDRGRLLLEADSVLRSGPERRPARGLVQVSVYGEMPPARRGPAVLALDSPAAPADRIQEPRRLRLPGASCPREGILVVGHARAPTGVVAVTADDPAVAGPRCGAGRSGGLARTCPRPRPRCSAGLLLGERAAARPGDRGRPSGGPASSTCSRCRDSTWRSWSRRACSWCSARSGSRGARGAAGAAIAIVGFAHGRRRPSPRCSARRSWRLHRARARFSSSASPSS